MHQNLKVELWLGSQNKEKFTKVKKMAARRGDLT